MTTRRELLIASASLPALAWAGAARAQASAKVRRIGLLSAHTPSATALWHEAFRLGLREGGWVEGKNISIEYRYAEGRSDRITDLAADLVRLKVDVIVASVTPDALAAQKATRAMRVIQRGGDGWLLTVILRQFDSFPRANSVQGRGRPCLAQKSGHRVPAQGNS